MTTERRRFLSQSDVAEWRNLLGGLEGWSPFFTPPPQELELFSKLNPPLDVNKEQFIFCPEIWNGPISAVPINAKTVTMRGQRITHAQGFWKYKAAFLLGTDSRIVAYNPKMAWAAQVLYEEIVSLDVQSDHFVLHLKDRGIADLHMRISRPGLLAAVAVMGAPTPLEKDLILSREKGRASDAQSFERLFSRFFAEIIDQNRHSGGDISDRLMSALG
jgi:hypothetical protein